MKRVARITHNGNVVSEAWGWDDWRGQEAPIATMAIIGPVDRIEGIGDSFHIIATNGNSIWADEIRREE